MTSDVAIGAVVCHDKTYLQSQYRRWFPAIIMSKTNSDGRNDVYHLVTAEGLIRDVWVGSVLWDGMLIL